MTKISAVITVYNKSIFLPRTIESLLTQTISKDLEYIFVDDASTDNSVEVIQKYADSNPKIKIIRNDKNLGPSIRLNQGAELAQGEYLLLMDGDDVLFENAAEIMEKLLSSFNADLIYGKVQKIIDLKEKLLIPPKVKYKISSIPLTYKLTHRKLVNMALMVKKELFFKAGGADPKVFIQDESLSLRLFSKSNKCIDLKNGVIGVLPTNSVNPKQKLSSDRLQQHHDRFMTCHNFIIENPSLSIRLKNLIKQRCIATFWKYRCSKRNNYISNLKSLYYYCLSRVFPSLITQTTLNQIRDEFLAIKTIRRI